MSISRRFAAALIVFILCGCSSGQSFNAPVLPGPFAGVPNSWTAQATARHQGDVVTLVKNSGQFTALAWDPDDKLLVGVRYGHQKVAVVLGRNNGFHFPRAAFAATFDAQTHAFYFTYGNTLYRCVKGSNAEVVTQALRQGDALASDGKGNIYVADYNRIVLVRNGIPTAISRPGSVSHEFYGVNGASIAVDTKHNDIYVSDPKGSIERILPTGKVLTIARGFNRVGGIVYDASDDQLIVSVVDKNQLYALSSAGARSAVAGYGPPAYADGNGWRAFLKQPGVLTYAGSEGLIYFSELNRVLSYSVSGLPAPKTTQPTTAFSVISRIPNASMGSPVVDGNFVWFTLGNNLHRLSADGTIELVNLPRNADPIGPMAIDGHGNLWLAIYVSMATTGIAERQPDGTLTTYGVPGTLVALAPSPVIGPDGNPWFVASNSSNPAIGTIANGKVLLYPTPFTPQSVGRGPDGTIWYGTQAAGIGRITTSGTPLSSIYFNDVPEKMVSVAPFADIWLYSVSNKVYRITASHHVASVHLHGSIYDIAVSPEDEAWLAAGTGYVKVATSGQTTGYYLPGDDSKGVIGVAASSNVVWLTTGLSRVLLANPKQYQKLGLPFDAALGR